MASKSQTVRLRVVGNQKDPYTLMIEPWGMTYDLTGVDHLFVDLEVSGDEHPELSAWPGGFSIWCNGPAIVLDASGHVLDRF